MLKEFLNRLIPLMVRPAHHERNQHLNVRSEPAPQALPLVVEGLAQEFLKKNNPALKRIFLARHGESVANQQKLVSGQLDAPLTEKGRNQAQWLCDVLRNETLSAIYTSSLSRTIETARPTAEYHGIGIQAVDNLKEIHFGVLQGRPTDGSDKDAQALWQAKAADKEAFYIPDSEGNCAFENRVTECLESVLQDLQGAILIVAHRNTNEVILSKLLGFGSSADKVINVKNKYLYEIELSDTPSINTIRLGGEFHGKKYVGLKDE
ncbi:MAG: histidine phosphatase family protein [Methyloglobulus sp.]|nr:histidine phosphatase family protein [Methyloglobulus sp.]